MRSKKTFILIILSFIFGVILTICIGVIILNLNNSKNGDEMNLDYGDSFIGIPLVDYNGKIINLQNYNLKYTFVFYLDKYCGSCLDSLSLANKINQMYGEFDIQSVILWSGDSGINISQKNNIPLEYNFTLDHAYINTSTPTIYILDQNKTIIFKAHNITDIVDKITQLDFFISDKVLKNINMNYIKKLYIDQYNPQKSTLVYFAMMGCPDCEKVNPLVDSDGIHDLYNVITLYYDKNDVPIDKKKWIDTGGLLAKTYGVTWYPSFLIIRNTGDYYMIGNTPYEELVELLSKE